MKKYFQPHELVSKNYYYQFTDKNQIFDLFDQKLQAVVVWIRQSLDKPMVVNNWKQGGGFNQRGYRAGDCTIGAPKSLHKQGMALDFDVVGMTAEEVRQWIIANQDGLPFNIRIEAGVSWVHIDVMDKGKKVYLFLH
jgi:uncharacterized protein YcbK (DUF882 family)